MKPKLRPHNMFTVLALWSPMLLASVAMSAAPHSSITLDEIVLKEALETQQGSPKISSSTLTLSGAPLFETPQSVEVLGQEYLRERNPSSFYETLDYVTGVFTGGRTPMQRTAGKVSMRGFSGSEVLFNRFTLPGVMSYYMDAAAIERIEFIRGPVGEILGGQASSGNTYGMGGSINIISKTPQTENFTDLHLTARGADRYQMYRAAADWNQVLADGLLLRVNAAAETEKAAWLPSDLDWGTSFFLAPALLWQISEKAILRYDGTLQYSDTPSYQGTPIFYGDFMFGRDMYYGDNDSRTKYTGTSHQLSLFAELTPSLHLNAGLSFASLWMDRQYWSVATADRARGLSSVQLYRQMLKTGVGPMTYGDGTRDNQNYGLYANLVKDLDTGAISHRLALGGDWLRRDSNSDSASANTGDVDLRNPDFTKPAAAYSESQTTVDRFGVLLQDLMAWKNLRLLASGRMDEHISESDNHGEGWNGQLGITWLVFTNAALYGNYTYSSAPAFGYTGIDGKELTDTWNAQLGEVGVKVNPWSDFWVSLAYFDQFQNNMPEVSDIDENYYQLGAKSESKGVETAVEGHLLPWWKFRFSYSYIDYENKDAVNPAQTFPPNSVVVWNTFELPADLLFSVGYRYRDKYDGTFRGEYLGPEFYIPEAHRIDVALEAPLKWGALERHGVMARFAIQNLFDEDYVESTRHCVEAFPGEGRTFELGLRATF